MQDYWSDAGFKHLPRKLRQRIIAIINTKVKNSVVVNLRHLNVLA